MIIKKNKIYFNFDYGRDKQDSEKAVLPTVIYISANSFPEYENIKGFMLAFGWWDWSIKVGIFKKYN